MSLVEWRKGWCWTRQIDPIEVVATISSFSLVCVVRGSD